MGVITLNWDNSAVLASANATAQRASKRIKIIGGAYDTVGFLPANDLLKTANTVDATVTDNRVYQFKIEAICTSGGPILNDNGVQDGIVFACFPPTFVNDASTEIQVIFNLLNTDITKVRVRLKKDSDDSLVGTMIPTRIGDTATATFSGLTASTNYYIEAELYADVNGVEVISSSAAYLNAICGGNIAGYQVATPATPACPAPSALVVGPLP